MQLGTKARKWKQTEACSETCVRDTWVEDTRVGDTWMEDTWVESSEAVAHG